MVDIEESPLENNIILILGTC